MCCRNEIRRPRFFERIGRRMYGCVSFRAREFLISAASTRGARASIYAWRAIEIT